MAETAKQEIFQQQHLNAATPQCNLVSSSNNISDDTTPSDSGIQLDSDISESMISQTGLDFDDMKSSPYTLVNVMSPDTNCCITQQFTSGETSTSIMDSNSNVEMTTAPVEYDQNNDMNTSTCSTFDASENIVYRRKAKHATTQKAPKKRVSFHEDILKNTRTDNIHIEHGFVTYINNRKVSAPRNGHSGGTLGRYSWCLEDRNAKSDEIDTLHEPSATSQGAGGLHHNQFSTDHRRHIVYRNACSDVLDYGDSDIYDMNEAKCFEYDDSGVFEYLPKAKAANNFRSDEMGNDLKELPDGAVAGKQHQHLYRCSCSSSNSSLDSDECDKNSNRTQSNKSNSCDCVLGISNVNNNFIGDNCYFSEPTFDNLNGGLSKKSVWNKEKKPKSSCLKKTNTRYTNVIQEHDLRNKMKKFNAHDVNQLLDNSSKMIFGSLKSIFTMPLPERGVPEGSEDLNSVVECLSELEQTPEHKIVSAMRNDGAKPIYSPQNESEMQDEASPPLKPKPFISKSLDGSKKQAVVKQFIHDVDEQLRRKDEENLYAPTRQSSAEKDQAKRNTPISSSTTHSVLTRQDEIEMEYGEPVKIDNTQAKMPMVENKSKEIKANVNAPAQNPQQFRNKFIINCESTVFEHTGVSYTYEDEDPLKSEAKVLNSNVGDITLNAGANNFDGRTASTGNVASFLYTKQQAAKSPVEPESFRSSFSVTPIARTFSKLFSNFKESKPDYNDLKRDSISKVGGDDSLKYSSSPRPSFDYKNEAYNSFRSKEDFEINSSESMECTEHKAMAKTTSLAISSNPNQPSSSDLQLSKSFSTERNQMERNQSNVNPQQTKTEGNNNTNSLAIGYDSSLNSEKKRHLPSPLKKRNSGTLITPQMQQQRRLARSGIVGGLGNPLMDNLEQMAASASASASCSQRVPSISSRDSKSATFSNEDFDDIITITTDPDRTENDIVMVDYLTLDQQKPMDYLPKPMTTSSKTSLISRFLRNVTQKKILESKLRGNNFFINKLKSQRPILHGELYLKGVKPKNSELIDDLNAEIAMEIEMSVANSPKRTELSEFDLPCGDTSRFELGLGEISTSFFDGMHLHFFQDKDEKLMRVFKLYAGYSREGYMTPVLVFLTNQTLYVTDLVRSRLCTKFALSYTDLDVILLGPSGNTVLLSNSTRDMQQVLLAGGPYPAHGLVSHLELCARRSGSKLPAVGQLTLDHLAPLCDFVRANSCVGKKDPWVYYAVVNVPAPSVMTGHKIENEQEPLGPHIKGFLMHRRIKDNAVSSNSQVKIPWIPGYFLLKAGVLYMFSDSTQKLPSWAMALAECQGARRAFKAVRPHCFEIMLRGGELLQLAAPDEYVASEWLQALLQAASGLFEMQEVHKTLGCTLVMTSNHLITLREDFTAPLKKVDTKSCNVEKNKNSENVALTPVDTIAGSLLNVASNAAVRNPGEHSSASSLNSTPTKLSQISSPTTTNTMTTRTSNIGHVSSSSKCLKSQLSDIVANASDKRSNNMSSAYGQHSGLEILTCADIKEMTGIKIPSHNDTWWCILEFSCQEVRECSDDLIIFFASSVEMKRFLKLLEQLWQAKNNDLFPITLLDEDDIIAEQCSLLYTNINSAWEPLLSAALGYPL